jgi:hypothetical protein
VSRSRIITGAALTVAALPLAAVGFGCDGAAPDAKSAGGDVCQTSAAQAISELDAVAGANTSCSTDADCVAVALGGSCFDACTRVVNKTGQGALDRALTPVEAGPCKEFAAAACQKIVPPCAPPGTPTCHEGRCQ